VSKQVKLLGHRKAVITKTELEKGKWQWLLKSRKNITDSIR
jgi:hypothetical protein